MDMHGKLFCLIAATGAGLFGIAQSQAVAQGRAGRGGQGVPPRNAASAPVNLTGYWVSIVSDEWRYRMMTPPKGNVDYMPVNAEARRVAGEWDPAKDEAAGETCRGYGAGGIMRLPERLHITAQDADTLKVEIDTGTQTRLLHFGQGQRLSGEQPSWQGYSRAEWGFSGRGGGYPPPPSGELKVVTTNLRPGYLRKNGVPYSANAILTEYFAGLTDEDGTRYLAVTTILLDPQYLAQPWVRTSQFKKQTNAAGWNPTPCSAR